MLASSERSGDDSDNAARQAADRELAEASGEDFKYGGTDSDSDAALKSAIGDLQVDVLLKSAEARHS